MEDDLVAHMMALLDKNVIQLEHILYFDQRTLMSKENPHWMIENTRIILKRLIC